MKKYFKNKIMLLSLMLASANVMQTSSDQTSDDDLSELIAQAYPPLSPQDLELNVLGAELELDLNLSDSALEVVFSGEHHNSPVSVMINQGGDIFAAMSEAFLRKFKASLLPAGTVAAATTQSIFTPQVGQSAISNKQVQRPRAKVKRTKLSANFSDESSDSDL